MQLVYIMVYIPGLGNYRGQTGKRGLANVVKLAQVLCHGSFDHEINVLLFLGSLFDHEIDVRPFERSRTKPTRKSL